MHITDVVSSVGIVARVWACFCKNSPTLCHHGWQARLCSRPRDVCSQHFSAGHPCEATQAVGSQEHQVLGQAGCSGPAAEVQRGLGHGDEFAATASQLDAFGEGLGLAAGESSTAKQKRRGSLDLQMRVQSTRLAYD